MNGFVSFTLIVSLIIYTAFAGWVITKCRSILSGVFVTAAAVAGGYCIYLYAGYIALSIIWIVRFAAVFAILAFIFGLYPGSGHRAHADQAQ